MVYLYSIIVKESIVTNNRVGRVEGREIGGGRGRGEGAFARALVWGDVDPHGDGLCARGADGVAICRVCERS